MLLAKQTIVLLRTEAMRFKQTKTLHVNPRHQDEHTSSARSNAHSLSGRAARAQLRELRKAGVNPDSTEWAEDDTDASKALLELARGQSNLVAHETLHDEGNVDPSLSPCLIRQRNTTSCW